MCHIPLEQFTSVETTRENNDSVSLPLAFKIIFRCCLAWLVTTVSNVKVITETGVLKYFYGNLKSNVGFTYLQIDVS